uniref:CSON004557 protein n=1 Tax=Culicoides sonorensis TaxID=179676 RepID=A0A336MTN5_CULSO
MRGIQSSGNQNNPTSVALAANALRQQQQHQHQKHHHNDTKGSGGDVAGAQDTIYLCNFRVSVDGDWLCLKELQDDGSGDGGGGGGGTGTGNQIPEGGTSSIQTQNNNSNAVAVHAHNNRESNDKCVVVDDEKIVERDWVNYYSRDPATIERSNLVNICKLVVKELLEQSLRFGRMLDSDHLPLQHFFIVLEHVLRHGLRPKKGLLGPKKELWDVLQSVEKHCPLAQDITDSVRNLPTVKTALGRARAWLRLAVMQKKLADYLQELVERRDTVLIEYYEPHALMMSDEIILIMGILVGLNVIDCNLCVKEEDLDSLQGVIDFSLYLRSSTRGSPDEEREQRNMAQTASGNMSAVLDQKNYIEELNRHLNATVANLQQKVEQLTTTNALMKEDLAIARNSVLALQAENAALRKAAGDPHSNNIPAQYENHHVVDKVDPEMAEALAEERRKRNELERELDLQNKIKLETDTAMKLLEKDIHEKQDTIVSLRRQLEDIKQINLDMYRKLQECDSSLKHKTELLSKLETQRESMSEAIKQLEKKYQSECNSLSALQETSQALSLQMVACEERAAKAEADARIERDWRCALQEKETKHKELISSLQIDIKQLTDEVRKHERIRQDLEQYKIKWGEAQHTLEELGIQLSVGKLQISELKEKLESSEKNDSFTPAWTPDKLSTNCAACLKEFTVTRRKHHCRHCGKIFCNPCSEFVAILPSDTSGKPVRVCNSCFDALSSRK